MSPKKKFVELLQQAKPVRGDVLFVLQGDGLARAPYAVELFKKGFAPEVAIVGNATDRSYGSFPSSEVRDEVIRLGVPASAIYFEEDASHTRAEAERAMKLAKRRDWKSILIVTSPHHQYRAFLTFLKAMRDDALALDLVPATAPLSMTEENPWGRRADLEQQEFDKIDTYQKKGDVASFEEGISYLEHIV